jgi:FkbM family methyltransferase
LGLTRLAARAASLLRPNADYEAEYANALLSRIASSDNVWDIGANVGYYTVRFSDRVSSNGTVHAFEPSPSNLQQLKLKVGERTNVQIHPIAVADFDGDVAFREAGHLSHLIPTGGKCLPSASLVRVPVCRADSIIRSGLAPVPTVVKIAVEGHELHVLKGFGETLQEKMLRVLAIEVHFGKLELLGLRDGPRQIEQILVDANFKLRWTDRSHLLAER